MEFELNVVSGCVGTISGRENTSVLIIILVTFTLNWGAISGRLAISCAKCGLFI
jgi:hypothetical protein